MYDIDVDDVLAVCRCHVSIAAIDIFVVIGVVGVVVVVPTVVGVG